MPAESMPISDEELQYESELGGAEMLNNLVVDVTKNFDFCTAFGKFKTSELMMTYVFGEIFPSMASFLNLRLPMKENDKRLVRKLLKLLFLCVNYKS